MRPLEEQLNEIVASTAVALVSGLAATVLFTIPGFLLHSAYLRGMRSADAQERVFVARTVVGSLLVHSLALPWTFSIVERMVAGAISPWEIAAWVLTVLLVVPVLAGSSAAVAVRQRRPRWLAAALDFAGLAPHVSTPDAWQWHFSRRRAHHVRVHLKDQRVVTGYLGSRSLASSDPANRDLYLERQYAHREGKAYGPAVPASAGVWISGEEIAYIEFHGSGTEHPEWKEST